MRVLLLPLGSHGDVHPFLGLGLALKARGHDVHVITNPAFEALVARHGFEFAPIGTETDYQAMMNDPDLWHPNRGLQAVLPPELYARGLRQGYAHIADRYRPGETVVAAGALAVHARLANEHLGVPLATVHLQPVGFVSVVEPPRFASLRMRWWWPHWFRRSIYWVGDRYVLDPIFGPPLNEFRRELGLPRLRAIFGKWLNSPQLVLGLFPEWFGNAPDWPSQLRLAGFVRYDQAGEVAVPPAVKAFLKQGDAPIVFSFGSAMKQGKPYFAAAVEACRLLGKRGLLLAARGGDQIPTDLPPTVVHADYAPFSDVFPRAAAVVHHGGIGTCAQGLAAGVPHLVMPLAFDQPDNAARLERLGVGTYLWPNRFTGANAAAALRDLLARSGITERCREVAGWMQRDDPAAKACEHLESLVGSDARMLETSHRPAS